MEQNKSYQTNIAIVGAGIVGLSLAYKIRQQYPHKKVILFEKEKSEGQHSSGRNSGVLHAGFYYHADSLKAQLCQKGNLAWRGFCQKNNLALYDSKKVVVAQKESEIEGLKTLYKRGQKNSVPLQWIDTYELRQIDPNVKSLQYALYSPTTATIDPKACLTKLKDEFLALGGEIYFEKKFLKKNSNHVFTLSDGSSVESDIFINAAGLYADQVAHQYGVGLDYTILPFKGLYLRYSGANPPVKVNVYPVPNLENPFLGVHFTVMPGGGVKIGPTATPAFWRENYQGFSRFNWREFLQISTKQVSLFTSNHFGFRDLALEEIKKYQSKHFIYLAARMVHKLDAMQFKEWTPPGIRAQLFDLKEKKLVQDFIVESASNNSIHILNAISPAFTCALPFADWLIENHLRDKLK